MQFGNPLVLWALWGCIIPVLIHLFRLRKYKTVYFSNTKILEDIRIETNKMSRIKNLIILLLRILAIACLVIAFAKPYIPFGNNIADIKNEQTTLVFIDNSFSMQSGDAYFSKLDEAKSKAIKIVNSFEISDKFLLVSNSLDATSYRTLNKSQFIENVNQLNIDAFSRNIYEVFATVKEIQNYLNVKNLNLFVISDFQKNFLDRINEIDNENITAFFVPVNSIKKDNLGIDSLWLNTPLIQNNQAVDVSVLIKNYSDEVYDNLSVSLFVNGERKSITSTDLNAKGNNTVELSFIPDNEAFYNCKVQIEDQSLTFDNTLYFSLNIAKTIDVNVLSGKQGVNNSLKALFEDEDFFNFKFSKFDETNISSLSKNGLLILDAVETFSQSKINEIKEFTNYYNNIVIIPSENPDQSYQSLLNSLGSPSYDKAIKAQLRVSEMMLENKVFKNVFEGSLENADMPIVNSYFPLSGVSGLYSVALMKLQNGSGFLMHNNSGKSGIYVFATPFNSASTNFHKHAVFVPVMYRLAFLSASITDIYNVIGTNDNIVLKDKQVDSRTRFKIENVEGGKSIIPSYRHENQQTVLSTNQQLTEAGNYLLYRNDEKLSTLSFNYNRKESEMQFYNKAPLDSLLKTNQIEDIVIIDSKPDLATEIKHFRHGKQLWKSFVFLALIFLIFEIILLRFLKK